MNGEKEKNGHLKEFFPFISLAKFFLFPILFSGTNKIIKRMAKRIKTAA